MTEKNSHLMAYFDAGGDPQCMTLAGCITVDAHTDHLLRKLYGDIGLAIDCLSVFGGVPVPVKQEINRAAGELRQALAAEHILHDMMLEERKAH